MTWFSLSLTASVSQRGAGAMSRLVAIALVTVTSGCTVVQLAIEKDQVAAKHRVAIIGFQGSLQLDQGREKNRVTSAVAGVKAAIDLGSGKLEERRAAQADALYALVRQRLEQAFGWEVVERSTLTKATHYQRIVADVGHHPALDQQRLPGVLPRSSVDAFTPGELASDARELEVDALVTVDVDFFVGKTSGYSVVGFGNRLAYPYAVTKLTVVDASGQVIWRERAARGAVTTAGLRTTMGADVVENETEVLVEAATTSFDAVLERYRAYLPPQSK